MSDFDLPIERRGSGSLKWDKRPGLDPLWVADMDFASPPEVREALRRRVEHGVFGYAVPHAGLVEAVGAYLGGRMGVEVGGEEIVHLGGLVPALSLGARAFGAPGEAAMTCTPVYPPFLHCHGDAKMRLITVDHVHVGGRWTFDWDGMEEAVTGDTRVFFLSNPQNPLGRVFDEGEIVRLAEFCARHGIVLLSDEVHCDLIFDEGETPHFSALHLPEELGRGAITLLSPSKTYNIAGLGYAYAVIPDARLRRRFMAARGHTLAEINCLAYYAAEAAYRHGEGWRLELLGYLRRNRDLLVERVGAGLPGALLPEIEATYLAWVDCRGLGHGDPAGAVEAAGLYLSDGAAFGWPGCLRVNFATQTTHLEEALGKLCGALG